MAKFTLSDEVLMRVVQIVQEGMIMGVDVVDLMRQVELTKLSEEDDSLVLTSEYKALVKSQHDKLVAEAEEFVAKKSGSIITGVS